VGNVCDLPSACFISQRTQRVSSEIVGSQPVNLGPPVGPREGGGGVIARGLQECTVCRLSAMARACITNLPPSCAEVQNAWREQEKYTSVSVVRNAM
jgi:hypothetical protein